MQPDLFASYSVPFARFTAGAWSTIELASPNSATGIGLGKQWFGEVDPWAEATWRLGPLDVTTGWTAYLFLEPEDARGLAAPVDHTHEIYARAEVLELPLLVPRVSLWRDVGALDSWYAEGSLAVRVPLWSNVLAPFGSLVLNGTAGLSTGASVADAGPGGPAYYADGGLTHLDFSAAFTIGELPFGPVWAAVLLEFHTQVGVDEFTKRIDATGTPQKARTWLALTWSMIGPRCRPARRLCGN
jgi:hypothetical protein